jgi:uncharacterized NAD-dependent epimerase/dehydratase family protein
MQAAVRTAGLLELPAPYLLYLGDTTEPAYAKTAFGLRDWARDRCVGEWSSPGATVSAGLERLSPQEARARGARSLLIGVANSGGVIGVSWMAALLEALECGLDLVSGMHTKLNDNAELTGAAARCQRRLIDVRTPPANIPIASGRKRSGMRLLTVGTDCALGKKYSALAIARAFAARGVSADFRATGQTGIMISGAGIPMDAVIADFAAGAAEMLSPDAPSAHWDVIEGQGSVFHPAYAGVSLSLLHGSQPDVIVLCHDPKRTRVVGHPGYALPSIEETIGLNLQLGRRTNPGIRCAGICLNTAELGSEGAARLIERESAARGMPVADPIRGGPAFERLIDACLGSG